MPDKKESHTPESVDNDKPAPVLRAELQIPQTAIDRYDANQKSTHRRERYRFWIEIGTLLAVVIYATIAAFQWCAMRQSVQQEVMINRPVVFGNGIRILLRSENKIPNKVLVTAKNFGRSVALHLVVPGHIVVRDRGAPIPFDSGCKKPKAPEEMIPTALGANEPDLEDWLPADDRDIATFTGGRVLYVVGCMYYRSLNGNPFYSDFCVTWLEGTDSFEICKDRNRNNVN
ncbi:MAG: hypothetical protein WA434_19770 [Candidatus Acidiferrales bacterium]